MRATCIWSAALVLAGACASPVSAQQTIWCAPALQRPLGVAPDGCGPGFYWANQHGVFYGPSHFLQPAFPPEQGITPAMVAAKMYGGSHQGGYGHGGPVQMPQAIPHGNPYQLFGQSPYGHPGAAPYPGTAPHPGQPGMPMLPNPGMKPGGPPPPTFVSHPWTRSPRDFFMWNEVMEDNANRFSLPALVP